MKIKDRVVLGTVAGLIGNGVKMAIDEVSLRQKVSQRSFRETASGVWVAKKKEATSLNGQILGGLFDFGISALGGIGITHLLSRTGRDHIITKGVFAGITIGSGITGLLSIFPQNKVKPKDAASNLSYMLSHAAYGVVTTAIIAKAGDPMLFDAKPVNDYVEPTEKTTEERQSKIDTKNVVKRRRYKAMKNIR